MLLQAERKGRWMRLAAAMNRDRGSRGRTRARRLGAALGATLLLALAAGPAAASAFAPLVVGVSATPSANGAGLSGTIYPYGLETTYRYEYGPTASYGTNVPVPDGDAGAAAYPATVAVPEEISGLPAHATYHFRLLAHSTEGTTASADQTFTTTGPKPSVSSEAAAETVSGFLLSGDVNPNGADAKYHFEYGTSSSYGANAPVPDADAGSGAAAVAVSTEVTGLLPNTTYHFRLAAHNSGGTEFSADRSFLTPPSPPAAPAVAISPPLVATPGTYTLRGAVNPNHLDTTYRFEVGTSTAYGTNLPSPDADIGSGETTVAVAREASGLAPNSVYHYRIVAHNSEGTTASPDQAFTTAPEAPSVLSLPATEVAGGFDLNASVDPHGAATTYHFDFGTSAAYGSEVPSPELSAGSGDMPVAVAVPVTGLPPGTPYHYRVLAHNAGGTSVGEDEFFLTAPAIAALPTLQGPAPQPALGPSQPAARMLKVSAAGERGSAALLRVDVTGAGTILASGRSLKPASAHSSGPGDVVLKVRLSPTGRRQLAAAPAGLLQVEARVSFRPLAGGATTMQARLTFRRG
jgi:hypothetical protein